MTLRDAMREASEWVRPGLPLKADARFVRHPDRYDPRDERVWNAVGRIRAILSAAGLDF